jgi:hypothetical protein
LEILKWAIENVGIGGCSICLTASLGGHLEILERAKETGYKWHGMEFEVAVNKGHLKILKWLLNNGFILTRNDSTTAKNSRNLKIKE